MDRQPTEPTDRPRCWSISYSEDDEICSTCSVAEECAMASEEWDYIHSLSELADQAEKAIRNESMSALYARKYEENFGRRPRGEGTDKFENRHRMTFGKVEQLTLKEDIDPEMWMEAQMIGMKNYLPVFGFQPNMLIGANALKRYRIQVEMNQRFYRNSTAAANSRQTLKGRIICDLTEGEADVGEYYVAAHIVGDKIDWDTAIDRTEPNKLWLAVWTDRKVKVKEQKHSKAWLRKCGEIARFRAACRVVNTYHPDIADFIGFRDDFEWESLAELMSKLFGAPDKGGVKLEGVGGIQWH